MKNIITNLVLVAVFFLVMKAGAQTAYIPNYYDGTVSVINVATNTVTSSISVSNNPSSVSVSNDGLKAYIGHDVSITTINTSNNAITGTLAIGQNYGIAVSPNGNNLYVANMWDQPSDCRLTVINTLTNTVTTNIPVGNLAHGVCVSPDGSKLCRLWW